MQDITKRRIAQFSNLQQGEGFRGIYTCHRHGEANLEEQGKMKRIEEKLARKVAWRCSRSRTGAFLLRPIWQSPSSLDTNPPFKG